MLRKPTIALRLEPDAQWPSGLPPRALTLEGLTPYELAVRIDALGIQAGLAVSQTTGSSEILDQYKMLVETSERLEDRRQSLHAFYVSINSLLLGAMGLLAKQSLDGKQPGALLAIPVLCAFGAFLCQTWTRQIRSYGEVRRSKFAVVEAMEAQLPAAPYVAEWMSLVQRQYESFTESEARVPRAFGAIYLLAALAAGIGLVVATL